MKEDHIHLFSIEGNFALDGLKENDKIYVAGTVDTYSQPDKKNGFDYRINPLCIKKLTNH